MKIKLTFESNQHIIIQLFDTPLVTRWANNFCKNSTYVARHEIWAHHPTGYPVDVSLHWNNICSSWNAISALGFDMPFSLPETFDYRQLTLNNIHRFFTKNAIWLADENKPKNPFDSNFILNISADDFTQLIEMLNNSVHALEHVVELTSNKQFVNDAYPIESIEVVPQVHNTTLDWMQFTDEEILENYSYLDHNCNGLVLLNRSILGKPVLQSFYENDDPTEVDVTGRYGSHGGFVIDTSNNRRLLYKSPEFANWLTHFNLSLPALPLELPIGYVLTSSRPLTFFYENIDLFKELQWLGTP